MLILVTAGYSVTLSIKDLEFSVPSLLRQSEADIHYRVDGEGESVFLLFNGQSTALEFWGTLATRLAERGRVIRFDQRNAGKTQFKGSFGLNDVAADAAALLDELEIDEVNVVGHAWGGRAAQVFVRDYPHRVHAMVICGTGGQLPSISDPEDQKALATARKSGDLDSWRKYIEKVYCAPGFHSRDADKFEEVCQVLLDNPPPQGARLDMRVCPSPSYWGTARVPALLIYGWHDKNGTPENAEDLHSRLYDSKLMMVKDAGHFVIREKEDQVLAAIQDFVDL